MPKLYSIAGQRLTSIKLFIYDKKHWNDEKQAKEFITVVCSQHVRQRGRIILNALPDRRSFCHKGGDAFVKVAARIAAPDQVFVLGQSVAEQAP